MKAIKANTENNRGSDPTAVVPSEIQIATEDQQRCFSTTDEADPSVLLDRLVGIASNQDLSPEEIKQERNKNNEHSSGNNPDLVYRRINATVSFSCLAKPSDHPLWR